MKNGKVYSVIYKDYQNRKHLRFVPRKQDVEDLKRNYEVVEVDTTDASFAPQQILA